MTALLAGGALLWMAPSVSAAADGTAYVFSDVQCDGNHNGVLDLTLINDHTSQDAVFILTDEQFTTSSSWIAVAPLSAHAITFTDLADGFVSVPVEVDGVDVTVSVTVECDESAVEVLPAPAPQRGDDGAASLPRTGSSTGGLVIGGLLVLAGIAASLVARGRYS